MHLTFFGLLMALLLCETHGKTTINPTAMHDMPHFVPQDKLREVEKAHLKNDDGFKAAVLYLQGEEWKTLVSYVMKSPEFAKFAEVAQKYHLNITQAINCMETYIKSLKVESTKITSKPNLQPFISDVLKVLPIGEFIKALDTKDNPEARRVIQEIGTKKNQEIFEALHNLPEMVKIRQILRDMNFEVEPYISLMYSFLGWEH